MVLCIDTVQRSLWSDFRFSYCLTWATLVHVQETSMYIISISCPIQCFTSELGPHFIECSSSVIQSQGVSCNSATGLMDCLKYQRILQWYPIYIYMIGVENFGWNETWDFCIMDQ